MVALISSYDELQRLTAANRGELVAAKDRITDHALAQAWNLDPTGNWKGFTNFDQATPGNDLVQQRTANAANEITDVTETVGDQWVTPAHDRSGNMTTMPQPNSPTASYTCTYDAWNRLVLVKDGATTIGQYSYDGLNRRIRKYVPGGGDSYQHLYYNVAWQLLETRESPTFLVPATAQYQYVYSLRYLDAPVLRDDLVPTPDVRLYYTGDANFNVTALFEFIEDLTAVERYVYDPYGNLTIYNDDWTATRSTSSYDNSALYTGQWRDAETGLSNYRERYYHAGLGRFIRWDPIGIEGGVNLYAYVGSNPVGATDPFGEEKHVFAFEGLGGFPKALTKPDHDVTQPEKNRDGTVRHVMGRTSASQVLNYWHDAVSKTKGGPKWHYYAQNYVDQAVIDITKIAKEGYDSDRFKPKLKCYHRIVLLGYSYGGHAAIQVARKLKAAGIQVDLIITADPVRKKETINAKEIVLRFSKAENVTTWHNYYQRLEGLGGSFGIGIVRFPVWGQSVRGADTNKKLEGKFFATGEKQHHIAIPSLPIVTDKITEEINKLYPIRFDYRYKK